MLNLRYHIVSITAVFLALGIGLALGATFVDSVLINNLRGRVDDLEADTVVLRGERDAAQQEAADARGEVAMTQQQLVDQERTFSDLVSATASVGRLGGVEALLVAPESVDTEAVRRLAALLATSDADYVGTMWIADELAVIDDVVAAEVAEQLMLAGDSPAFVTRSLNFVVPQALLAPNSGGLVGAEAGETVLTMLADLGLLRFDRRFGRTVAPAQLTRLADVGSAELVVVFATDGVAAADLITGWLGGVADAGYDGAVVLAQLTDAGDTRTPSSTPAASVRSDDALAQAISTVTDVDQPSGELALIVALLELPEVTHRGGDEALHGLAQQ